MNLSSVRVGDIVHCDVKGRRFYALVEEKKANPGERTRLAVRPITNGVNFFEVRATQVVGHWRHSRRRASAR
jgi:hypothetical protein